MSTGDLEPISPVAPVWADIEFIGIGTLHLKCYAAAVSDDAVLVQTGWQGRRQDVVVARSVVTKRVEQQRRP